MPPPICGKMDATKRFSHKLKIYVKGDIHTNTVESAFSLLKRGVMGTWHKISAQSISRPTCKKWNFDSIGASGPICSSTLCDT